MTKDECFQSPITPAGRKRLRQIHKYLVAHWPPPQPTKLLVSEIAESHDALGMVYEVGKNLVIRIDSRHGYYAALETLLHEWAHVRVWGSSQEHDGPWAGAYTELLVAFEDGDALEDSKSW